MIDFQWYHSLNQPLFMPPDWLFRPVWGVLYLTIFLSLFLFLRNGNVSEKKIPLTLFIVQIILNFLWTPIFFGYGKIGLAFIVCLLLWLIIPFLIFYFYKYSKLASIMLLPYFLWITFALYLNFEFWRLN